MDEGGADNYQERQEGITLIFLKLIIFEAKGAKWKSLAI